MKFIRCCSIVNAVLAHLNFLIGIKQIIEGRTPGNLLVAASCAVTALVFVVDWKQLINTKFQ